MSLTIADVAQQAGVSIATVDRALNGRPGVHARTVGKVLQAAQRIGYVAAIGGAPQAAAPVRLAFVLPGGSNAFLDGLSLSLQEAGGASAGVDLAVHRLDSFRPQQVADGLRQAAKGADGVGVVALDHPAVREAIRDVDASGCRVLTLVTDIGNVPRTAYVGIDNRAAGRLAGHLLGRFHGSGPGEVALFAGSLRYRGHEEREMGFRRICAEDFPGLTLLPTREVEDDSGRAYEAARDMLAKHAALSGIYSIGGGVRGIASALQESGRAAEIVLIGHELTDHTRRFLVSGVMDAVIDQDAAAEATRAVELLAAAVRGAPPPAAAPLRLQAVFRENLSDPWPGATATGGNA